MSQGGNSIGHWSWSISPIRARWAKMGNSYFVAGAAEAGSGQRCRSDAGRGRRFERDGRRIGGAIGRPMRQFEMLNKAISLTSDMDKKSVDEVARITPGP